MASASPISLPVPQLQRDSTRLWLGDAIERQAEWLPAQAGTHVIPGCGHWVQQERPDQVNALLLEFPERVTP
jgi:pimeloyl-ACP methyl ester carboxylesterase